MLDQLSVSLSDRVRLYLQANLPLERQHISCIDMLEMTDVMKELVIDDLTVKEIQLQNKKTPSKYGGYKKYKGAKKRNYSCFWDSTEHLIQETANILFKREIKLQRTTKQSVPLSAKRFIPIIVHPMFEVFQQFHPEDIIKSIGTENDPFDWLKEQFMGLSIHTHSDDIKIAQKLMVRYSRGQ